jgi:hypothetical protein
VAAGTASADRVHAAIDRVLSLGHFFVALPARLRIEHVPSERIAWDTFQGHLLDAAQTRETIVVDSWNVWLDDAGAGAPLISIHRRYAGPLVHVTRRILTYGFEAYEESPGMILSRETQKWIRELVGTVDLERTASEEWEAELSNYVSLAVFGTSRLPITSLESPLPACSLGQLAYAREINGREAWSDPIEFFGAILASRVDDQAIARGLETALRAISSDQVIRLAEVFCAPFVAERAACRQASSVLRSLFNSVALSPYTAFVDRLDGSLREVARDDRLGPETVADVVGYMLRHLCRHLTAFDLTQFHNLGANYPDALFLDALLKTNFNLIEYRADLFLDQPGSAPHESKRRRRRALRQGCLARRMYEGHRVPDAPTSMGERLRVLPPPFDRVPEEQIVQPERRRRVLFDGDPLEALLTEPQRRVLAQSMDDLGFEGELAELGTAQFLARPLGTLKQAGEVDRTPLVAYVAVSREIVRKRLDLLESFGWISATQHQQLARRNDERVASGLPASAVTSSERPGVVSLADANKVANDFVISRSTAGSLNELISYYDWQPLERLAPNAAAWLISPVVKTAVAMKGPGNSGKLQFYDAGAQLRLELAWSPSGNNGYDFRHGIELVKRLRVERAAPTPGGLDLGQQDVWITLK